MEKIEQIKQANKSLLTKLEELEKFFSEKALMNDKEELKYYRINESLTAKEYKEKIINETNTFKTKFLTELQNLSNENVNSFIKKLVNNYAKFEDGYYALLNTYNNPEMSASVLFRSECLINYLKESLEVIIDNCDKVSESFDAKSL